MTEIRRTNYKVVQTTNNFAVDAYRGEYEEAGLEVDKLPRASFHVRDDSGVLAQSVLTEGKEFKIYRGVNGSVNGEMVFHGIIETPELFEDARGAGVIVRGVHRGYKMLQQHLCDTYDYDEDGFAATTRDAVTVNPWRWFIFRKPGGDLNARGEVLPIDGVSFDDVVKHIIGTKFVHQIDFQDNSYLRASTVYTTTNRVQVYRDGPSGDLRPALQKVRKDGSGFLASDTATTIPLHNGSVNIESMGDISSMTVTLVGVGDTRVDQVQVSASRNALHATPSYSSAKTVTHSSIMLDDGVTDTGLDKWVFTFSNAELPASADKDSAGIKILIPGTDGESTTTKIYYAKVECVTASDTGLANGTIDAYDNPVANRSDLDDSNWVESDFATFNRLEAMEKLRSLTESDEAVNTSPHWDIWIDATLAVHFQERRGADLADWSYSFANGNLRDVKQRYVGNDIAYQTIAYGAGSGAAQSRIVSSEEYSSGGLYDSDRDPSDGALYGQLARVMKFVDSNETSPLALYRKARAFHKLHRAPIESVEVTLEPEFIRHFGTGDGVTISNLRTRTSGVKRVVNLSRAWDGGAMEKIRVRLGNSLDDFARHISNGIQSTETLAVRPQPSSGKMGLSGDGVNFTKDYYGQFSFAIPENATVDRVVLKLATLPWQITARGGTASNLTIGTRSSAALGTQAIAALASHTKTDTLPSTGGSGYLLEIEIDTDKTESLALIEVTTNHASENEILRETHIINGTTAFKRLVYISANQSGKTISFKVTNLGLTSATFNYNYYLTPIAEHVHNPEFGIWQFDGDSGNGTGTPVYGTGITLAVDPTVDANGIPSTFATEKIPHTFGSATAPQSITIDVTGYLATDGNGIVKSGEHKVYLKSAAGASNAEGLAVVSVTPILRFKGDA